VTGREETEAAADELRGLRRRLLVLARLLPVEYLRLLDAGLDDLEAEVAGGRLGQGLSDSVELVPCDVEAALREVWARTQAG
jgi:hypothetical protein